MKRFIDILMAVFLIAVLWPAVGFIWLLLRLTQSGPALFRQSRPGLGGKVFELVKFRTMSDARGQTGELLPDQDRITKFGQFLRSTSLDELPELWNVLVGDMSFVGPRPLLVEYLPLYTSAQARRHAVRPGITGWAQVNGRNAISWEEKFALDIEYVDQHNLLMDLKILALTVLRVFQRSGISAPGEATIQPFTGNGAKSK